MVGEIDAFAVGVAVVGGFGGSDPQALRQDSTEVLNTATVPQKLDVAKGFFETFRFAVTVYFEYLADFYIGIGFFYVFLNH